jgi:hypothetical protein
MKSSCRRTAQSATPIDIFDLTAQGASSRFKQWRDEHPESFFLSCRDNNVAHLHRINCVDDQLAPSVRLKVCATHSKELRQWAARQGVLLLPCTACKAQ